MRKLFSCLYGSNLYGTATPTSDRDVKHIVLPDLDELLLYGPPKNKVEKTNLTKEKNGSNDVDEEFISIHTFAREFVEGQSYALSLAFAVDGTNAEQTFYETVPNESGAMDCGGMFFNFCRELKANFLTSNMHAMTRFAVNQASLYSDKGERLNAARETLALLEHYEPKARMSEADPLVRLEVALLTEKYPECVRVTEYDQNGRGNLMPSIQLLERTLPFTSTFENNIKTVQAIIGKYGKRANAASVDNVDWKATMQALRVINDGIQILITGQLVYPYPSEYANHLLRIKHGELDYEWVKTEITNRLNLLTELEAKSELPEYCPELVKKMESWLLSWLKGWYGLPSLL